MIEGHCNNPHIVHCLIFDSMLVILYAAFFSLQRYLEYKYDSKWWKNLFLKKFRSRESSVNATPDF